jgi:predicted enzyme related to lactoylglutathione lyase
MTETMSYEAGAAIFAAAEQRGPKVYFGVADIDAAIARVRELGGEAGDKQEIPGIGFYAECPGRDAGLSGGAAR